MRVIYFLFSILLSLNIYAAITDLDKALIGVENVFQNGGVESGKNGFSANGGTSAIAIETTNKLSGKASIKFTSSGATDYLATSAYAVKHGPNAMMSFYYKTTSTAFIAEVMQGANIVATLALPANTAFQLAELSFVAADAATTYHLHIRGGAAADIIYVDDLYEGKNLNIGSVAQAEFIGSIKYNTNCSWTRTSASFGDFTAVPGCTYSTTGNISAITGVLPGVNVNNPKSGTYMIIASGAFTTGANESTFSFTDGTNYFGELVNGAVESGTLTSTATYTTAPSSLYFKLQVMNGTGNQSIYYSRQGYAQISVYRFPSAAEQVVRAENANQFGSVKWVTAGQAFSTTSATYVDLTGTTGTGTATGNATGINNTLAFSSNNLIANKIYKISAYGSFLSTSGVNDHECVYRIFDGTTEIANADVNGKAGMYGQVSSLSGYISYPSTQATKTFSVQARTVTSNTTCYVWAQSPYSTIFSIEEVYPNVALPQIIQSVGTSYQGVTVLNSVTASGAAIDSACASSPCTTYRETGDWVSSVVRNSTGYYIVSLNSGIYSAQPNCMVAPVYYTNNTCVADSISTALNTITIDCRDGANTSKDNPFTLICHGTK